MKTHTDYIFITTDEHYEILDITDRVAAIVRAAQISDGLALVSAMHITSSVFVNDREPGLWSDILAWVEGLAPAGKPYAHHATGEDNGDAHLKRMLLGHQVIAPITRGALDLGTWERIHYGEFDGRRRKRVIVKVMGE